MSRLIFGSCSSQHYEEQPLWPVIKNRNATAFIWGGDAIYADDRSIRKNFLQNTRLDATPEYLRQLYDEQRRRPGYKALLETNISVFGTIDDHDYGVNNGDRTFPYRRESGIEFVRFLGFSEDSIMFRRASQGQGVYGVQVYDFGRERGTQLMSDEEAGLDPDVVAASAFGTRAEDPSGNRSVAVFVLDVRSNKTPWTKAYPQRFQIDTEGDFLGEEQWKWFEEAIGRSNAAVNVIVTGIQVHAERYFDQNVVENWSGFPRSQHRLHEALLQPNVRAPILISGDVHKAQLMRKDCRRLSQAVAAPTDLVRPLYEITTSGMTHSWGTKICGRANSVKCHVPYFNALFGPMAHLAHWMNPWTELLLDEKTSTPLYSLAMNVAELDFDWDAQMVSVRILGQDEDELIEQEWTFQDLTFSNSSLVQDQEFAVIQNKLAQSTILNDDFDNWICVNHRGLPNKVQFVFGVAIPILLLLFFVFLPFGMCLLGVKRLVTVLFRRTAKKTKAD